MRIKQILIDRNAFLCNTAFEEIEIYSHISHMLQTSGLDSVNFGKFRIFKVAIAQAIR